MIIEIRDIDTPHGKMRVEIQSEDEFIADPRVHVPEMSNADIDAWYRKEWEFVSVVVTPLHYCEQCRAFHEAPQGDSLGMVILGRGDGWEVTIDQLFDEYPVPEMITELGGHS